MRYTETKERSSELLRLALAHMGRHEAAFNPSTFALWYEYAAGTNAKLTQAVDRLVAEAARIDDEAVAHLHGAHIAPADEAALARVGGEMQRLMTSVVNSAMQTGDHAGTFGAQLSGLTEALASSDVTQLAPRLSEVLAGTTQMKSSVEALQQKVTVSQEEIERLRVDLERARGEALLDPLTGLLNRKGFDQKLQALLEQPVAAGKAHGLVMLDIDKFKNVNDTHGHLMGDRVIQGVGEILRAAVTRSGHAVARYGGEEFAILMPLASLDECVEVAELVRARTKAMKIRNRKTQEVLLTVTISGGVSGMQAGDDAAALISRADAALYASKNGGRDRVTRA
jgi:diguanylate cyclase